MYWAQLYIGFIITIIFILAHVILMIVSPVVAMSHGALFGGVFIAGTLGAIALGLRAQ